MRAFYKQGFMLLKSDRPGPIFIAPHSTVSLVSISRGDVSTELITARLVKKLGGIGVVSTVPRKGKYGIDYFRDAATMEEAVSMFRLSGKNNYAARHEFEKKYSFFARDGEEYLEKINSYNQFWTTVEMLAPKNPFFAIIHAQGTRLKNFPSLLDIATLSGKWIDEKVIKWAIEQTNIKNMELFGSLKGDLKTYSRDWAATLLKRSILYRFKQFDINNLEGSIKSELTNDIKRAAELTGKDNKLLMKNLSWEDYVKLVEESIDKNDFCITYQNAFDGKVGDKRIGKLLSNCGGSAVSFETAVFLNEMYPNITVNIIQEMINHIVRKEKLKVFEKFINNEKK